MADLQEYDVDMAIISKSHLKKKHVSSYNDFEGKSCYDATEKVEKEAVLQSALAGH